MDIKSASTFHESLHSASSVEAIAAPSVCCRHCSPPFPISGYGKVESANVASVAAPQNQELGRAAVPCAAVAHKTSNHKNRK